MTPTAEYKYSGLDPCCSHAYIWGPLQQTLAREAPAPQRLFEIGCGNGANAERLAGLGYDVTAVDISQSGIELAKRRERPGMQFHVGSAYDDLAARFGQFPIVISLETVEHLMSPRDFMKTFRALLAPGGVGLISTPYHGYLKNLALAAAGKFDSHFDPLWDGGHVK